MVASMHYEDDVLIRFLRQGLDDEDTGVASHVEQCETCQTHLETLSRSELSWDEIAELLKPQADSYFSSYPCVDPSADPCVADDRPTFLRQSTHPNSLGRFGRYEIMEVLGRGGMGVVMRGFDPALNRYSAIKVLAPELASSAAARRRFSREAKSAAAVVHPHVVPIQTVDEQNGMPYLVMPVVEGQSVEQRVRNTGPLTTIEVVRIAAQIAEGLAAAHEQGLVHRDIKPANVLLENGVERVQITDFGLARAIDDASMTRSGMLAGTPQYMSPEQAHGDSIDHRSDLFSLGSLVYFMFTGRSPFRAETTMGVLNRIGNDPPRSLRSVNPDVPEWLEAIVFRLLAKDPADRFQSADEVANVLSRWLAHLQTPDAVAAPEPLLAVNRSNDSSWFGGVRRWLAWGCAGGLLALFGTLLVIELNKGTINIQCEVDDVPVLIKRGGEVYEEFVVGREGHSIRVRTGAYEILLGGESGARSDRETPQSAADVPAVWYDSLRIDKGKVEIGRGKQTLVRIEKVVEQKPAEHADLATWLQGVWVEPANVQIMFSRPHGMHVTLVKSNSPEAPIICPGRIDLISGATHRFQLQNIPEFEGAEFYASIELENPIDLTKPFLAHNSIPIGLAKEDFGHALANNLVTKVFYLPNERQGGALAGVQVLTSSRMDPGKDPVSEANKIGTVVAVLRLGNRQAQPPHERLGLEHIQVVSKKSDDIPPPSDQSVLNALQAKWGTDKKLTRRLESSLDQMRIVKEKLADRTDQPRHYPLVGIAQQRTARWKCTIYFDESIVNEWPIPHELKTTNAEVVYLTTSQLILLGGTSGEAASE